MPRNYNYRTGQYELTCLTPGCGARALTQAGSYGADRADVDSITGRPVHDVFRFLGADRGNAARCRNCEQRRRRAQRQRAAGRTSVPGTTRQALGITRRFGVELELLMPRTVSREDMTAALRAAGCSAQWRVKGDVSVSGAGLNGHEVVSPPLHGEQGEQEVRIACRVLRELGGTVNRSCGTHVHHEVNDLDVDAMKRAVRGWFNNQPLIDGLVSSSRRADANGYCRGLTDQMVRTVEGARDLAGLRRSYSDRYRTLNVASYARYGTLEVRQHQGTLNAEKVISWIRFGQAMMDAAKIRQHPLPRFTAMRSLLGELGTTLDETAKTYLLGRTVEFGAVAV